MQDKNRKSLVDSGSIKKIIMRIKTVFLGIGLLELAVTGYIPSHYVRRFVYRVLGNKNWQRLDDSHGSAFLLPAEYLNWAGFNNRRKSSSGRKSKLVNRRPCDIASEVMIYNAQHDMNVEHFAAVENIIPAQVAIEDYVFIDQGQ